MVIFIVLSLLLCTLFIVIPFKCDNFSLILTAIVAIIALVTPLASLSLLPPPLPTNETLYSEEIGDVRIYFEDYSYDAATSTLVVPQHYWKDNWNFPFPTFKECLDELVVEGATPPVVHAQGKPKIIEGSLECK